MEQTIQIIYRFALFFNSNLALNDLNQNHTLSAIVMPPQFDLFLYGDNRHITDLQFHFYIVAQHMQSSDFRFSLHHVSTCHQNLKNENKELEKYFKTKSEDL